MEEGRRSGEPSRFVVKNRTPSGCLIVKKKGGDAPGRVGTSGSRKVFESKKERKRARLDLSDSGSSDELLMPPHRRYDLETISVCNGLPVYDESEEEEEEEEEESDIRRKRSRGGEDVGLSGRNGDGLSGRKRNKLDVFEFDEYNGNDDEGMMQRRGVGEEGGMEGQRFFASVIRGRSGMEREYMMGMSRHGGVDRRKGSDFEKTSRLNRRDHGVRDGGRLPISFLREKYDSGEPIKVQGKNGLLKVMVKKKKVESGSFHPYDGLEGEGNRKSQRMDDSIKRKAMIHPSFCSESKSVEKASSFAATSSSTKNGKVSDQDSEDSDTLLKLGPKKVEVRHSMKTPLPPRSRKGHDMELEDSDTSLKPRRKKVETCSSVKGSSSGSEKTPCNQLPPSGIKEGKVKRGTGTEKQKLRERIRGMLLNAGWKIDYRPRRNRDYLDAVYVNPSGTAYWSIIKAYDALLKQLNEYEDETKPEGVGSPFTPLSDEVLSQLTRRTRKKMEKELRRKQKDGSESEDARETAVRRSSGSMHDDESMDSGSHEEKLSSFIKQGGKGLRSRFNDDGFASVNSKGQSSAGSNSHQGRKSKKLGRCTLLVRNSNEGLNSESDGFVPYAGKRTLLSWLIDCGTVQLSQKVRYMNRRRTKVMLEGWVTRDGIHCGCCSKILTVSKFEIHAGSKLRQPFQNIYVDSGVSLLECQIDAWNKHESVEHIGFHPVDIDGDDPNDDTCGLCGDGGDLICCDSCPSTFHQSCLDIQMLPLGDWHCPNCTCKICGVASEKFNEEKHGTIVSTLLTCSLCERKYHNSCMQQTDAPLTYDNSSITLFCGKKCSDLFEQLQKCLGVKHELEAGFSWSLVHRTEAVSDTSLQGIPQRVECSSKLAVALSVMDECFLPIIDRRSGISIIRNVLYNCGSNFNRLNYSGFYAVILERGDEIISAASIRFHGTQLAEMPFIGTRHIYRRQGMCRRLFGAIESALCTLKIEKLIIPAVSELMHTWTEVFGFTSLDESSKQELKSLNMLVFPGIDMLHKQLLEEKIDGKKITSSVGTKLTNSKVDQSVSHEVANKSDIDCSAGHDPHEHDNSGTECASETNDGVATTNSDSQCVGLSLNDTSGMSSPVDESLEIKDPSSLKETINTDSELVDAMNKSTFDGKNPCISGSSNDVDEMDNKIESDSHNTLSHIHDDTVAMRSDSQSPSANLDDASIMNGCELKNPVSPTDATRIDSESGEKLLDSASGRKSPS